MQGSVINMKLFFDLFFFHKLSETGVSQQTQLQLMCSQNEVGFQFIASYFPVVPSAELEAMNQKLTLATG